jgi:hypothetical protein
VCTHKKKIEREREREEERKRKEKGKVEGKRKEKDPRQGMKDIMRDDKLSEDREK